MIRSRPLEISGRYLGVLATDGRLWRFRAIHPAAEHADGIVVQDPATLIRRLCLFLPQERAAPSAQASPEQAAPTLTVRARRVAAD